MDFAKLAKQAKKLVDKRGGMKSVADDAKELEHIATAKGSLSDKAKRSADAVKDPGAPGPGV
jgi:hypothetical protein